MKFSLFSWSWWRHQMETFSALLALCTGNSPVTGELPSQRPLTQNFDVSLICALNTRLSKQSWAGDLRRHRPNYDVVVMMMSGHGNILRINGPSWREFTNVRWILLPNTHQWYGALVFPLLFAWKCVEQIVKLSVIWDAAALMKLLFVYFDLLWANVFIFNSINSLRPADAHMRQ